MTKLNMSREEIEKLIEQIVDRRMAELLKAAADIAEAAAEKHTQEVIFNEHGRRFVAIGARNCPS